MNLAVGDLPAYGFADLSDNVRVAVVIYRVHRIKTQPVKMIFFEPVKRIVNEIVAHRPVMRAPEIDCGSPGRVVALSKEIGRDRRQVISLRTKMIVNDVEQYGEPAEMARLDQ